MTLPTPPKVKVATRPPESIRLTKSMRAKGIRRLERLRMEFWEEGDEVLTGMLPMEVFLPTDTIADILDNFLLLLSKDSIAPLLVDGRVSDATACSVLLRPFTRTVPHLEPNTSRLLEVVWELHTLFDELRMEEKQAEGQGESTNEESTGEGA